MSAYYYVLFCILQAVLTRASHILNSSSEGVLYFKEISILVPSVWNYSLQYEKSRPNETYDTARIVLR